MNTHEGSCLCGKVEFTIQGQLQQFYLCHCSRCRKNSGSAHAATLFSTSATLSWHKGEELIKNFTLPNTQHQNSFCSECGAPLPNLQMKGTLLAIPAGSLDTAVTLRPNAHIFTQARAKWDTQLEALPEFPQQPV